MANSYLVTLFLFIFLQINLTATGVWQKLGTENMLTMYLVVLALVLLLLLYGFTHAVKANVRAKGHSYVCAFFTALFGLASGLLIITTNTSSLLTLSLAVLSVLSAIRLAGVTYKITKSYFV